MNRASIVKLFLALATLALVLAPAGYALFGTVTPCHHQPYTSDMIALRKSGMLPKGTDCTPKGTKAQGLVDALWRSR